MGFEAFAVLLVISVMMAAMLHMGMDYQIREGWDSFVSKAFIGWVGAYMGMTYFGQWFQGLEYQGVYLLPAMLGSFVLMVFAVDVVKTLKKV